ncbi:MAG TPA: isoprenylcysteine carboxylmethyltransferase family protein, partial [Microbacteriaceae bacterium]|nr:isoprenylcysteine carboxylmethyltransferase family protein [Microbacteriaceae bacterium]
MAWALVVAQFGLLLLLVLLPTGSLWATGVLTWVLGGVLVITGISLVAIAGFGLGRSLTPLPIPKSDGELVTDGLYRFARHPIYTGVLITACGLLLAGASLGHLFAAAALSVVL